MQSLDANFELIVRSTFDEQNERLPQCPSVGRPNLHLRHLVLPELLSSFFK